MTIPMQGLGLELQEALGERTLTTHVETYISQVLAHLSINPSRHSVIYSLNSSHDSAHKKLKNAFGEKDLRRWASAGLLFQHYKLGAFRKVARFSSLAWK